MLVATAPGKAATVEYWDRKIAANQVMVRFSKARLGDSGFQS